jgi:hypothetical protein
MAKHIGLLSSLVAGAAVTLAASSAQAQTALDWAQELVTNITPEANTWGTPCSLVWGDPAAGTGYSANTNGACLFTLSLKKADPTITNSLLTFWWGSANPSSPILHDQIVAENHFTRIQDVALIQPGDLLAVKYTASGNETGYVMIVGNAELAGPGAGGSERYLLEVYDSTRSPHSSVDTRWNADAGAHDWGAGIGYLHLDADPSADGAIVAHTWSTDLNGSYYTQEQRHLVVGRFVR